MNSKKTLFTFASSLFKASFCCGSALFLLYLPYSQNLQERSLLLLKNYPHLVFFFALSLLLVSGLILFQAFAKALKRTILIKSGSKSVEIHQKAFHQTLHHYLREHFPGREIPYQLSVERKAIEIAIDFPFFPEEEQKVFLESVKNDLSLLLQGLLGWQQELHLYAHFQEEK